MCLSFNLKDSQTVSQKSSAVAGQKDLGWYKVITCGGPRGVLQVSSDGDDRMGAKIKTQKIPRASNKTKKNPWSKN